jgi:hypothetical protein
MILNVMKEGDDQKISFDLTQENDLSSLSINDLDFDLFLEKLDFTSKTS